MNDPGPSSDGWLGRLQALLQPELEVVRALGRGSVGRVLLAREPALRRLVAVKVLREELAGDEVARARFEREAQAAAGIRHPNVTAVYRVGRAEGIPYIVMEHIEGRTIADLLRAGGPVDATEARRILTSVAHALAAAHRKGVVHRDVRTGNVMIEEETGRVVLMDFGIAALLETGSEPVARLTATGVRLGDPLRMSPEQIQGEPVTAQSDVYGLGVLAYEILTGAPPPLPRNVGPPSGAESRTARVRPGGSSGAPETSLAPDALERLRPASDPELVDVVRRCLSPTPEHRPRAADVAHALMRAPSPAAHPTEEEPLVDIPVLHEFLREVKRRKVGRVAIAYVAVAFVFLQAVDLLARAAPAGSTETWYRAIVAVTLAGFPMALVLSWLFDITSEGIRRAPHAESGTAGTRRRRLILPLVALAVSVLAAIGAWLLI